MPSSHSRPRLRCGAIEATGRTGIQYLDLRVLQGRQHSGRIAESSLAFTSQEITRLLWYGVFTVGFPARIEPGAEPSIENPNPFMPHGLEHPPGAGTRVEANIVVDHDVAIAIDAQLSHLLLK